MTEGSVARGFPEAELEVESGLEEEEELVWECEADVESNIQASERSSRRAFRAR